MTTQLKCIIYNIFIYGPESNLDRTAETLQPNKSIHCPLINPSNIKFYRESLYNSVASFLTYWTICVCVSTVRSNNLDKVGLKDRSFDCCCPLLDMSLLLLVHSLNTVIFRKKKYVGKALKVLVPDWPTVSGNVPKSGCVAFFMSNNKKIPKVMVLFNTPQRMKDWSRRDLWLEVIHRGNENGQLLELTSQYFQTIHHRLVNDGTG